MAIPAAFTTASPAKYLAMAISRVNGRSRSFSHAPRRTRSRPASTRETISAITPFTSWYSLMGLPNWILSLAYLTEASRQAWANPMAPLATLIRPRSSAVMATTKPLPHSPKRFSLGALTPSRVISAMGEDLSPSFGVSRVVHPGWSVSTTTEHRPRCFRVLSYVPYTTATSATVPFEIQVLAPLMRK